MKPIKLPQMDPELVSQEIGAFIVNTILRNGATGGVLGLSGGVDSTTVAALAKKAFDEYNAQNPQDKLELVGYMLPSNTNNPTDTRDGIRVANQLGLRYEVHGIEPVVNAYESLTPDALSNKYDRGNLTSRIRGNVLNTFSATERKTLLGTGNKDEDFGIGYYTLFGDGAVHCSPISGLSKRLVREMAHYFGFSDLAERVPTAGLEHGQTDFKDLGYDYDVVELVTEGWNQGYDTPNLINHPQVKEMVLPQLEKYKQKFGQKKFENIEGVVYDIEKRNTTAKAKAEVIHPPTPQITLRYD
jgi:NAD+ synthase